MKAPNVECRMSKAGGCRAGGGEHGTPKGFTWFGLGNPPVGRMAANRGQMTRSPYGAGGKTRQDAAFPSRGRAARAPSV